MLKRRGVATGKAANRSRVILIVLLKLTKPGRAFAKTPNFCQRFPHLTPNCACSTLPPVAKSDRMLTGKKSPSASTAKWSLKLYVTRAPIPVAFSVEKEFGGVTESEENCTPTSTFGASCSCARVLG